MSFENLQDYTFIFAECIKIYLNCYIFLVRCFILSFHLASKSANFGFPLINAIWRWNIQQWSPFIPLTLVPLSHLLVEDFLIKSRNVNLKNYFLNWLGILKLDLCNTFSNMFTYSWSLFFIDKLNNDLL